MEVIMSALIEMYIDESRWWVQAVNAGDFVSARQVLERCPQILREPANVAFLMEYAAGHFQVDAMADLLSLGVDINVYFSDNRPDTPLFQAVLSSFRDQHHGRETVRWLLSQGAAVSFGRAGKQAYPYPLVQAIKNDDLEMVRLLAEATPDLNALGEVNKTPLSWAVEWGRDEIAAYLRSKGAKESREIPGYVPPPPPDPIPDHVAALVGPVQARGWVPIISDSDPQVTVRAALREDGVVCLFTDGMSARPMPPGPGGDEYRYAELALCLSGWPEDPTRWLEPEFRWPLDWLRRLARYPFDNGAGFGGPVAIVANGEPPEPLGPNTALTCWLLLADKEPLGRFEAPDGREIVFYQLTPIHTAERDFERENGWEALLERFAEAEVPEFVAPSRVSSV